MLRRSLAGLVVVCVVAACNKSKPHSTESKPSATATPSAAAQAARQLPDACTLLSSDEINSVLGEPVQQTKPTSQASGGITTSQCYFALPTAANSAVLTLMSRGAGNATRTWWEDTFHNEHEAEKGEREAGEKAPKPEKVDGLGDEAFWTASKIGGVLYVLKGDTTIRISVGGKDDLATKLKKSRALSEIVLKRL